VATGLVALPIWVVGAVNQFLMVKYRKPDVSMFSFFVLQPEVLSNVVDGKFLGGGLLGFDSVDEFDTLNHVG
jgi:hypothetical protein